MKLSINLLSMVLLSSVMAAHGEVYKRTDVNGRIYFSDSPLASYQSSGYQSPSHRNSSSAKVDHKALEKVAKGLKKERLQREKARKKALANGLKKRKKQQKLLAAAEKRKQSCRSARKNEDLAFRKRSQGKNLNQLRSALANYEKKRDLRKARCQ